MYQAKSGVKNFPLYWGGGGSQTEFVIRLCASLSSKNFLGKSNFPEFHGAEDYIRSSSQEELTCSLDTIEVRSKLQDGICHMGGTPQLGPDPPPPAGTGTLGWDQTPPDGTGPPG